MACIRLMIACFRRQWRFGRLNRKRYNHTCDIAIRAVKWIPVLSIWSVIAWGYYAYVIQLNLFTIDDIALKTFNIIISNLLCVCSLWCYWQTIFTESPNVPEQFWFSSEEKETILMETDCEGRRRLGERYASQHNLPVQCRTGDQMYRICAICWLIKPDRAHHCRVCQQCTLKMDHHCPWVNNCISFANYKYFVQLLGYALIMCWFSVVTSFPYFLKFWTDELPESGKYIILMLFAVSFMFAMSLSGLLGYHVILIIHNTSTIESFQKPVFLAGTNNNGYDQGKYNNFCQVFGYKKVLWLIPINTSIGNGYTYEVGIKLPVQLDTQSDQIYIGIETN